MKKATFLAVTLLSTALISGHLYAQDNKTQTDLAINQPRNTPAASSGAAFPHEAAVSTINVRAIKDFKLRFTKVEDESWGYLVHLEDKLTFKIVRVSEEGEMDVLNEYVKAN